jgi:hypothetical protein
MVWTPVFTGVTIFYDSIFFKKERGEDDSRTLDGK